MINITLRLLGRMLFDCSDSTQFQQQELMHADSIREVGTGVTGPARTTARSMDFGLLPELNNECRWAQKTLPCAIVPVVLL